MAAAPEDFTGSSAKAKHSSTIFGFGFGLTGPFLQRLIQFRPNPPETSVRKPLGTTEAGYWRPSCHPTDSVKTQNTGWIL